MVLYKEKVADPLSSFSVYLALTMGLLEAVVRNGAAKAKNKVGPSTTLLETID